MGHFADRIEVVGYAGQGNLKGLPNGELWEFAREKKALLVTQDRGFRRRYNYHDLTEVGIILLALRIQTASKLIEAFQRFMAVREWRMEDLEGRLVIISEKGIVVRFKGRPELRL